MAPDGSYPSDEELRRVLPHSGPYAALLQEPFFGAIRSTVEYFIDQERYRLHVGERDATVGRKEPDAEQQRQTS